MKLTTVRLYCKCGDRAKITSSPAYVKRLEASFWLIHWGQGHEKLGLAEWYQLQRRGRGKGRK